MPSHLKESWGNLNPYWRTLILWLAIVGIILLGTQIGVDKTAIAIVVALFALATHAFSSLVSLIGLIPYFGPMITKVITLPFFLTLNGLGYFLALLAIKRGYTKEVVNYRVLTFAFLLGVIFGYILGKLL